MYIGFAIYGHSIMVTVDMALVSKIKAPRTDSPAYMARPITEPNYGQIMAKNVSNPQSGGPGGIRTHEFRSVNRDDP